MQGDGFGEELIAVTNECDRVDRADGERPVASSASLVAQICGLVRRADENALPGLNDFLPPVARSVTLNRPRDEGLQSGVFRQAQTSI